MLVDGLSTLYQLQRALQGSGHTLFVGKFKHFVEGKVKLICQCADLLSINLSLLKDVHTSVLQFLSLSFNAYIIRNT